MSSYKLTYFDITALGETIRFLLALGDLEYEDVRVQFDDFLEMKPSLPFGQLPIFEVDGKVITQSLAISRYLSKKVGINGKDDWEDLFIDEAVDHVNDFRAKIAVAAYEKDEAAKAKKLDEVKAEGIPYYLKRLDEIAAKNDGYFALGRLTLADIYFVAILPYLNYLVGFDLVKDSPNLQKLVSNVENTPKIKEWIAKRPATAF